MFYFILTIILYHRRLGQLKLIYVVKRCLGIGEQEVSENRQLVVFIRNLSHRPIQSVEVKG